MNFIHFHKNKNHKNDLKIIGKNPSRKYCTPEQEHNAVAVVP
jgi:hypothetical protein